MFPPTDRRPPARPAEPNPMLQEILQRIVRIETRLARLMLHMGLTVDGDPRPASKKD